jgi:uncharacterized protein YceK
MKKLTSFLPIIVAINISGCASIFHTTPLADLPCAMSTSGSSASCPDERNLIYIGARKDVEAIFDTDGGAVVLPLVDFPLSVVFDTIFLPYTIPYTLLSQ